jgi:hypothetical protein
MSMVVIGMYCTYRSFRHYSMAFVFELHLVQCGYWLTNLFLVWINFQKISKMKKFFLCLSESFFTFCQITFTCMIAFHMYRSVIVSNISIMENLQKKKQQQKNFFYIINVICFSFFASLLLTLIGFRIDQDQEKQQQQEQQQQLEQQQQQQEQEVIVVEEISGLSENCRTILYIYFPLMAFLFHLFFYLRFQRTIGQAYPISATGRFNQVVRLYLIVFCFCWGSLMLVQIFFKLLTVNNFQFSLIGWMVFFQSIFDLFGVFTAIITIKHYFCCRRTFDFGLCLKAIDPNSIEFEKPLQILGEGTFAIVFKAKWYQGNHNNGGFLEETTNTTRNLFSSSSSSSSSFTTTSTNTNTNTTTTTTTATSMDRIPTTKTNTTTGKIIEVAVKTFKHTQFETLEQMKEEAYLASKLIHPCVMMTYGCFTDGNNHLYIVSEYLGGGTLQDIIDANIQLPYETILRFAHMIAQGMRFLHGLPVPIIHRDLKPLNCIFDTDQEMLKLADFGESRLFRKENNNLNGSKKNDFFPSDDMTITMTTNIGSACWAVSIDFCLIKSQNTFNKI